MNSDVLLQLALPRNTNKLSLMKQIAQSRGIHPSHLRSIAFAYTGLSTTQDIAFGYQFKLAFFYLILNYIDIVHIVPNSDNVSDNEDIDEDEDDEDMSTTIPLVPKKMDFILSQLTLLDQNPIQTSKINPTISSNEPYTLPQCEFPNADFERLIGDDIIVDLLNNDNNNNNLNEKIVNEAKFKNFFGYTNVSPLRTNNHNTHIVANYMKQWPYERYHIKNDGNDDGDAGKKMDENNSDDVYRFKLCAEDLTILDIMGILAATYSPILFLLGIYHICECIINNPSEYEHLAYFYDRKSQIYTLFPTKSHMIAYLQLLLVQYTEFIPYNCARDQVLFLSAQIPPHLISPNPAQITPKSPNHPDNNKYAISLNNNPHTGGPNDKLFPTKTELFLWPAPQPVTIPVFSSHPSIIEQLSHPASDFASLLSILKEYYSKVLVQPKEIYNTSNTKGSAATIDKKNQKNNIHQQIKFYSELPILPDFQDTIKLFYDDYVFNPALQNGWIDSPFYSPLSSKKKIANESIDIIPPSSGWSPYPTVPSVKQLGRVETDYTHSTPNQLCSVLQSIIRQNQYREAKTVDSTHLDTGLTIFVAWQYVQMQDQLTIFLQLLTFLNKMNETFYSKLVPIMKKCISGDDMAVMTLKNLLCVDGVLQPKTNNTLSQTTTIYLDNYHYMPLLQDELDVLRSGRNQGNGFIPQQTPMTYTINNVICTVDITNFIPARFIYPTTLSPLSLSLLSSNFIQPRLLSLVFYTSLGRGFYHGETVNFLCPKGQLDELLTQAPDQSNTTRLLSLYEICLFGQAAVLNGIIQWLMSKMSYTDQKMLRATLHTITYHLLEQTPKPPTAPPTNTTPKKQHRQLQQTDGVSTHDQSNGSNVVPDHLLNRISTVQGPGRKLFDAMDPEGLEKFLQTNEKARQMYQNLYCAAVEYTISFGLATLFTPNVLNKLATWKSYVNFNNECGDDDATTADNNDNNNNNNHNGLTQFQSTHLFPSNNLGSHQIVSEITNKINTKGYLPAPGFIIYGLTPLLLIDIFPQDRQTFTNRLLKLSIVTPTDISNPNAFSHWSAKFEGVYLTFLVDRRNILWSRFLDSNAAVLKDTQAGIEKLKLLVGPHNITNWMEEMKLPPDSQNSINDNQTFPIKFNNLSDEKKQEIKEAAQKIRSATITSSTQVNKSYRTLMAELYTGLVHDKYLNALDNDSLDDDMEVNEYISGKFKLLDVNFRAADIAFQLLQWCQQYFADRGSPASLGKTVLNNSTTHSSMGLTKQSSLINSASAAHSSSIPFGILLQRQQTIDNAPNSLLTRGLSVKNTFNNENNNNNNNNNTNTKDINLHPLFSPTKSGQNSTGNNNFGYKTPMKYHSQGLVSWPDNDIDDFLVNSDNDDDDDEEMDEFINIDESDDLGNKNNNNDNPLTDKEEKLKRLKKLDPFSEEYQLLKRQISIPDDLIPPHHRNDKNIDTEPIDAEDHIQLDTSLDGDNNDNNLFGGQNDQNLQKLSSPLNKGSNSDLLSPNLNTSLSSLPKLDLNALPMIADNVDAMAMFKSTNDESSQDKLGLFGESPHKLSPTIIPHRRSNSAGGDFVGDGDDCDKIDDNKPALDNDGQDDNSKFDVETAIASAGSSETQNADIKVNDDENIATLPGTITSSPEPNKAEQVVEDVITVPTPQETTLMLETFFKPIKRTKLPATTKKTPLSSNNGEINKQPLALNLLQHTILHDNSLIIYNDNQIEKMSHVQSTRYKSRLMQLDSVYQLEMNSTNMITFSDTSDDDDDDNDNDKDVHTSKNDPSHQVVTDSTKKNHNNKGGNNNKKNNDSKKNNENPNLTPNDPLPPLQRKMSKWVYKRIDTKEILQSNTILSLKLEHILDLDENDQDVVSTLVNKYQDGIKSLYQDSTNGIINDDDINKLRLECRLNKNEEINMIKKYVQCDERFASVWPL